METPDSANTVVAGPSITFTMSGPIIFSAGTMEENTASSVEQLVSVQKNDGYPEVTGQYDLAVSGARAFKSRMDKFGVIVVLPTSSGAMSVGVTGTGGNDSCPQAYQTIGVHVVETVRPA